MLFCDLSICFKVECNVFLLMIALNLSLPPHFAELLLVFCRLTFFLLMLYLILTDYLTKPLDVLSEAGRVLRPGGAVYITYANAYILYYLFSFFLVQSLLLALII